MTVKPLRNKPWTDADSERLKALIASGASPIRAAAIFNRSLPGIREMARKLGTPFPSVREARKKFAGDPQATWHLSGTRSRRGAN
jgi:hypothetical protein